MLWRSVRRGSCCQPHQAIAGIQPEAGHRAKSCRRKRHRQPMRNECCSASSERTSNSSLQLDPQLGQVMADPDQIHQVIMNLVVNARDAMPNGGKLEITTEKSEWTRCCCRPSRMPLRDDMSVDRHRHRNGDGREDPAEVPSSHFSPPRSQERERALGWRLVYGIVRQSGGWIDVQKHTGQGVDVRDLHAMAGCRRGSATRPAGPTKATARCRDGACRRRPGSGAAAD